jgi:hypothetical protein
MVLKKTISFLSKLSETTVFNGINICKGTINRINGLISSLSGEERLEGLLKGVIKSHDVLRKESIINLKDRLLSKNKKENNISLLCPKCGLPLPPYYTFCVCCGTQLFDDILNPEPSKLIKYFPKITKHLLDVSVLFENLKPLLFMYKKLDKCLLSLFGWNNRV